METFVWIVTRLVLNALQLLINAQYAHKDYIFMKANVKNAPMDGLEMMKMEIVRRMKIQLLQQL